MPNVSRREFFRRVFKGAAKGAAGATAGAGIVAGAAYFAKRRKAVFDARTNFFRERKAAMPEEWAKLEIPAKRLESLKLSSGTLISVEMKAKELGMGKDGVLRVLKTIKYNDVNEIGSWNNALNSSNKAVAERAKRVLNLVRWFNKLEDREKNEIKVLLDFVPETPMP
jgi:hypothetical protein